MATNWNLCIVCQLVTCKGERDLTTQVANLQIYGTLMNAAQCGNDETMIRICGEVWLLWTPSTTEVVFKDIQRLFSKYPG